MPQAKAEPTDARHLAMATVNAAVIKMHEQAMRDRPKWFWHLLKRCEAKAERIAAQAAQGQYACDATFIEVYAKTLPTLFTQALERLDSPRGRTATAKIKLGHLEAGVTNEIGAVTTR